MGDLRIPGATYGMGMPLDERNEAEQKQSTAHLMNEAAHRAGALPEGEQVSFGGGSPSYGATKESAAPKFGWNVDTVTNGCDFAQTTLEIAGFAFEGAEHLALMTNPANAVLGVAAAVHSLTEAWKQGDEQNDALKRDALQVGMLGALDLPDGYRAAQMDARPDTLRGDQSPATKIVNALNADPKAKALLQLRADEGMTVGQQCLGSGRSPDAFFKLHDDVAKRYQTDAAFHAGFDAMLWAHQQGPAAEASALTGLHGRDARLLVTSSQVWAA